MPNVPIAAALLASAALVAATAASAAPYTLIFYETPAQIAARTDPAKSARYWSGWSAYGAELAQAGVLRGGSALRVPPASGTATKGPQLSGYMIIDVPDDAVAQVWAAGARAAGASKVDVRAAEPNPAMP